MTDQHLWAPWRLSYITREDDEKEDDETTEPKSDCFLCDHLGQPTGQDRANLIVHRGEHCVVVLNRYPYNNGHLLVAPRSHKAHLTDLSEAEHLESMQLLSRLTAIISEQMDADGFNIGLNLGRVAGAGLPGHLHWHLVPRWNGDTNFMPVIADTKVIPQALDSLYDLLTPFLEE